MAPLSASGLTFPPCTPSVVLEAARLDQGRYEVDVLSAHRDVALAIVVDRIGEEELLISLRSEDGKWTQVDTIGGSEGLDAQFGGARSDLAGHTLIYRIPGIITQSTTISARGNWAFVYSDPQGRKVAGTSTVASDFWRHI